MYGYLIGFTLFLWYSTYVSKKPHNFTVNIKTDIK